MATLYDLRPGTDAYGVPFFDRPGHFRAHVPLDFSVNNLGSADSAKIWNIPANVRIDKVTVKIATGEGATATVDIGDFTTAEVAIDADGYANDLSIQTATILSQSSPPTLVEGAPNTYTPAYGFGKLYTAAAVMHLLANNALDAAVIDVFIEGVDFNS